MKILHALTLMAALATSLPALASRPNIVDVGACGNLHNHYGPFDYRTAHPDQKNIVEIAHFTPVIENLAKGRNNPFGDDLAYTLRVFPNHVRALSTLQRLVEREKTDEPKGARFPIECYFIRAITFVPDDHLVRMLYADFLFKRSRIEDARKQLDFAASTTRDNPLAQLNAARLYLDHKQYDKALEQTHLLMAMGFERPELRNALVAAGQWKDPAPESAADSASAAASAANPTPPATGASSPR
jgi:predicted Zn-dependent protease